MFEKGSEWRRWDLHIHTPETNKNDNYQGCNSEEKWENFYESIETYIHKSDDNRRQVAVIGITDYLSIDNYKKVIRDNKLPKEIMEVFPNVEMRIVPMGQKSPVNIHFIFNPEFVDSLESRFFAKLSFNNGDRTFTALKDDLIALGKTMLVNATEEAAYHKGVESFIPSYKDILELFSKDLELRENTLIGVANKSTDGASGIDRGEDGDQLTASKWAVYKLCDFIFSANPKDINYFVGRDVDSEEDVIQKYGSLKPCFHGCDAHDNSKIFEPDKARYCWIKADSTFNGLKQVIYEPIARVRIDSLKPEEKSDYQVIEKVVIKDPSFGSTHNANVVLGGDADEIIVANQNGNNAPNCTYRFEYRSGSIENDSIVLDSQGKVKAGVLNSKGIQQHICDILEGGEKAFDLRKHKYRI